MVYLEPGDEIIVPQPTFSEYKRAATLCGATTKEIPVNDQMVVDLPAMAGAISSRTKIIYICNPNNPTGTVINKRHLLQMLHRIGKDILVVLDEAYYEYVDDDNSPDGLEFFREFPNVIVLRTFSKAYGLAGLRVGYALARAEIVAELNKAAEPFSVTSVSQAAALAAWQDKEYLKKSVNYNRVERDFVATSLRTMGLTVWDSQANFLLVDLGMDSQKVYKELKAKGIIVRSAATFGYRQAIRVSIGLRRENDLFLQALKEVLNK